MNIESKFEQLVASSGNAFHARVATWLKEDGWDVVVSPYYIDQTQGKAREIDIVAEKICKAKGSHRHHNVLIIVRLFIECKFVAVPSVFWFAPRDRALAEKLVAGQSPFRLDNNRTQEHHYLSGPMDVAKVFASSAGREPDNEPFYKALSQVLGARSSMRGMPTFVSGIPDQERSLKRTLEFPLIVVNSFDNIRSVQFYGGSQIAPISGNFQLEVRYANSRPDGSSYSEYLLIDVAEFDRLGQLCAALNRDSEIASLLV